MSGEAFFIESIIVYVQELKVRFSQVRAHGGETWRQHVAVLEERLRIATAALEQHKAELEFLRATVAQSDRMMIIPPNDRGTGSRPKKKREPENVSRLLYPSMHPTAWNTAIHKLVSSDIPSTTMTDFRIIGTIATLDQISLRNQSSRCLVPLVARMFRFLGDRLASAISSPASQSSLEQLVSFFPVLLTRSLSLLPVDAPLSDIVEVFVQLPYDCVILPIVRSFGQIGRQRLSAMLESGDQSQDLLPLDIRPTLFGICKSLVLCLSTRPRLQTSLSLLLAFSSSQQLEIELSGQKECSIGSDYWLQRSPLRDSFWYLSALLRVAFLKGLAPQENDSESIDPLTPIEQVAKEAIISRLGTILHEDKWPPKLTTVERNVLIALVEIAYNTGWINLSG